MLRFLKGKNDAQPFCLQFPIIGGVIWEGGHLTPDAQVFASW